MNHRQVGRTLERDLLLLGKEEVGEGWLVGSSLAAGGEQLGQKAGVCKLW